MTITEIRDVIPRHTAVGMVALVACALAGLPGGAVADTFAISSTGLLTTESFSGYTPNREQMARPGDVIASVRLVYREADGAAAPALVLDAPCRYVAGADIGGTLKAGPLPFTAMGTPAPSNVRVKQPIYLIQVADVAVHDQYDVKSFIGVRKDGTFVPNIILHSNLPGLRRTRRKMCRSGSRRKTAAIPHQVMRRKSGLQTDAKRTTLCR